MNNNIAEIYKVLSLFDYESCDKSKLTRVLNRMCEETNDSFGKDKSEYYLKNKTECIDFVNPVGGFIANRCNLRNCGHCPVQKWCNHYRNHMQSQSDNDALTYVDFFCGSGGLSLGFSQEGFKLSLANDIQESCIETYSFNHPDTPAQHIVCGDINNAIEHIDCIKRFDRTTVVMGGPPCQGFSMANRQRIIDDPRNHLYKSYIKAISILKPDVVVMENVRGMMTRLDEIYEDFNNIGYAIEAHLLKAEDFGVPQHRERLIFIGNNLGIDNKVFFDEIFRKSKEATPRVLGDALYGLKALEAKSIKNSTELDGEASGYTICLRDAEEDTNDYINQINVNGTGFFTFNHKARYNNKRDIEIFRRLNPGDKSDDPKIADIMPYKSRAEIFKDKYYKLDASKVCKTITAHMKFDCNMYIHPTQARGLTPREAARVQSYPDDYYFRGAYTKTYMQVGNSVPPLMSRAIASSIKKVLESYKGKSWQLSMESLF